MICAADVGWATVGTEKTEEMGKREWLQVGCIGVHAVIVFLLVLVEFQILILKIGRAGEGFALVLVGWQTNLSSSTSRLSYFCCKRTPWRAWCMLYLDGLLG